jgi:MFS transporter, DHA1 family, multidrug resistance protein
VVAPWPAIFGFLALISGATLLWVGLRLPETLPIERRHAFGLRPIADAARYVCTQPASILYWVAMMLLFGALLTYVATMPQVFNEVFHQPDRMAVTFAAAAGLMGVGSLANVHLVERLGMHRISHAALIGLLLTSAAHVAVVVSGHETVLRFTLLQGTTMLCFGLCLSNFGAISMQPMGRVAGSAASLQGMAMGLGGALLGALCGSFWHGSIVLLPLSFLLLGLLSLLCVLRAERGRLFHHHYGALRDAKADSDAPV